jgi:predicted ester cyclase
MDSKERYRAFANEEQQAASGKRSPSPLAIAGAWRKTIETNDRARFARVVDVDGYTENCLGLTGWTTGFERALGNLYKNQIEPFADLEESVEEIIEGETTVVIRARNQGTHVKEFMGIAPTGRRIEWDAIAIIHTRNGRVVGMWAQADLHGIYLQLTR